MVSELDKKPLALVYYRDIPVVLDDFIKKTQRMSYIKDGVQKINGLSCPRITLLFEEKDPGSDKALADKLNNVLVELSSNHQIVAYAILKKF